MQKLTVTVALLAWSMPALGAHIPPVEGHQGMVVSAHRIASDIGIDILRAGGNASDAVTATAFALSVVYPIAGNLGGGGFLVTHTASEGTEALDFRERAPAAAHRDLYLDDKGEIVPRLSLDGWLAVGVPGSVAGLLEGGARHGRLSRTDWISPAIQLARDGFILDDRDAGLLNTYRERLAKDPETRAIFVRNESWEPGDTLRQPDLATTLERIREDGHSGFYEGQTADLLVGAMKSHGGLVTHRDLVSYRAVWRAPVTGHYRGYEIASMPPPSSGGIALLQILGMLEPYDLRTLGAGSTAFVHLMSETERRAYADRAVHLGDSDFWPVPIQGLTDATYLLRRMSDFSPDHATPSEQVSAGSPPAQESNETTHISVLDGDGGAASLTTTINAAFGAAVVAPGTGFLLNDEMDDFSSKPGVPNQFGLVGGEANAIQPGKRPLSSMTPTIVSKDGHVVLVVGSPGGSRIITTVAQIIVNVLDFGMDIQEAVSWPRFHHQWLPDAIRLEPRALSRDVMTALRGRGHTLDVRERPWSRADAVLVGEDGTLLGGADPRGPDAAAGF